MTISESRKFEYIKVDVEEAKLTQPNVTPEFVTFELDTDNTIISIAANLKSTCQCECGGTKNCGGGGKGS